MHDLPKVSENYNLVLVKVRKVTVTDSFNLPKVRKIFKVTCPKLVSYYLSEFDVNPATQFHDWEILKKHNFVFT